MIHQISKHDPKMIQSLELRCPVLFLFLLKIMFLLRKLFFRGFANGGILNGGIFKDRWPDILRQALNMQKLEGNTRHICKTNPSPASGGAWGGFGLISCSFPPVFPYLGPGGGYQNNISEQSSEQQNGAIQ